ncbi:MAG: LysR substrate-binding domain-containing protein [Duodenibacillus sp.]|nr:LysR substrate-binding domain-containing protein [Duodenibacillus sp.]
MSVFEPFNLTPYAHRTLPWTENWGVIVPQNPPFASQCAVNAQDLRRVPIIVSAQMLEKNAFTAWLGCDPLSLQMACTYNLIGTALQMASQGIGALIGFEGLSTYVPHLKFLPFNPPLTASVYLIAKHGDAPKHVKAFLDELDGL